MFTLRRVPHREYGLTWPELMAAFAIIAILGLILVPAFLQARDKGHLATCASNLRQIGTAFQQYLANNDGKYPGDLEIRARVGDDVQWEGILADFAQIPPRSSPDAAAKIAGGMPPAPDHLWICPNASDFTRRGGFESYGLNAEVIGWQNSHRVLFSEITHPATTILVAETYGRATCQVLPRGVPDPGAPSDPTKDTPAPYQVSWWAGQWWHANTAPHAGKGFYCFADGHVQLLDPWETVPKSLTVPHAPFTHVTTPMQHAQFFWARDQEPDGECYYPSRTLPDGSFMCNENDTDKTEKKP